MRNRKKADKPTNSNYVFGRIPVLNSLENKKGIRAMLQHGFSDQRVLDELHRHNIPISFVNIDKLNEVSKNGNHQGVILETKPFEYSDLDSIIHVCTKKEKSTILILDGIEDPHNFGAIIRSCDAFGVDGIIIKSANQVPVNMTVSKVSTGAIEYVRIAQVSNLSTAIKKLKEFGFWIYSSDGSANTDFDKIEYAKHSVLVVGSEGKGISRLVLENSDFVIKIPMIGHVNSLNVSVATGILLKELCKGVNNMVKSSR